jgi:quercetin dioxygenase-like cupin family protein
MAPVTVTRCKGKCPGLAECERQLRSEGLEPYEHELGPRQVVGRHEHPGPEVRLCCRGEIEFTIDGKKYLLGPGDRIEMPPFTPVELRVVRGPAVMLCATR